MRASAAALAGRNFGTTRASLSGSAGQLQRENEELRARVEELESGGGKDGS